MEFDDFIYNKKNVPQDPASRKLFFDELKKQFYEEIKTSTRHQHYFKKFNPASVEAFMLDYADRKAHLAEHYTFYSDDQYRVKEIKYRNQTEEVFKLLLHKKLFNLELIWRAEKIKIKDITIASDFYFWHHHVTVCPFIEPVDKDELELLKRFVSENSYEDHTKHWFMYVDYDELMERDEEGDFIKMPDWYQFYDNLMGTAGLLKLPNIRGEKEECYIDLARQANNKAWEEKMKTDPPKPYVSPPPYLQSGADELYEYAKRFETDKHFRELFKGWQDQLNLIKKRDENDDGSLDEALELLHEADQIILTEGGHPWQEALIRCSRSYLNGIIITQLDNVYDEYLTLKSTGLTKGESLESVWNEHTLDYIVNQWRGMILQGRKIAGEPEDFNF